ncbi:alpha/beta hydrolase [Myxococcaceae bacterium GXIMD 01537]
MKTREVTVNGKPATVHVGGRGTPLLLVHGGWGGAELHWGRVWGPLSERFHVVAPELPGVGDLGASGLRSIGDYAGWLEGVLDALGLPAAVCVGNSFGAAAAWKLATRAPARCQGLVLVNGVPLPRTPGWLIFLGTRRPTRGLLLGVFRKLVFSPQAEAQAFVAPEQLPAELRAVFRTRPPQLEALFDALGHGGDGAMVETRPLMLWGEEDRLGGTRVANARQLQAALPRGADLALIPRAGHLPQLENPEAFLAALVPFVEAHAVPAHPVRLTPDERDAPRA